MPDDFLSHDASSIEFERIALRKAVKGTRREQLESIRDYIADQLEANLCDRCANSRLRTGDQASLILRLQTVLGELEALGDGKTVNRLAMVRDIHSGKSPVDQRRTGTRKPGAGRPEAS